MSNEKEQNVKLTQSSDKDEEVEVTNEILAQVPELANYAGTGAVYGVSSSSSSDVDKGTKRLLELGMSLTDVQKAMADPRLSELAVTNPKKAKSTIRNRQSAAKCREKADVRVMRLETEIEELNTNNDTKAFNIAYYQNQKMMLQMNNNMQRTRLEALVQKKIQSDIEHINLSAEWSHYNALHQQQQQTSLMQAQQYQPSQPGGETGAGEGSGAVPDDLVDTVPNRDAAARPEGDAAG